MTVGAIVALVVLQSAYRTAEARGAGLVAGAALRTPVWINGPTFYLGSGTHMQGFQVTIECTGLVLLLPVLALHAVITMRGGPSVVRAVTAPVAAWLVISIANVARIAWIGIATQSWGFRDGYEPAHGAVGAIIGISGFACGTTVLLLIDLAGRTDRGAR
ncbi:hypothetical protein GCM10017714_32330 [Curtobacterium pusillum]|uniref:Archaeosortase/exosortase family protein n=1 Tax=Curtobacterium pusillum TaxID=69373 RepID=A0ABX2MD78_9MICO|nr:archaeosortase/exosortase family protein [Curtobacterium pusillum]NUU14723.1 archaeosortase/exosortase family protein [Curtobacterium pusillum]GLK31733.1 hypothetical protein GCM10017610_20180 [Curtobacterium pusillum]